MHIAYFSPNWPPADAANGVVAYISAIRTYLLAHGHEVSILSQGRLFTSDGHEHDFAGDISSCAACWARIRTQIDGHLGHRPWTARTIAAQLRKSCRIAPIDLVEMEESFGWSHTAQQRLNIPVVTRLHGPQVLKPKLPWPSGEARRVRLRVSAEGRAICAASALTAPSRAVLEAACALYGRSRSRGEVIPNPVPVARVSERWRLDGCERDLILNVGRFDRMNGADTILAAFQQVLAYRPTARLLMAGPDGGLTLDDGRTLGRDAYVSEFVSPEARQRISFLGPLTDEEIVVLRQKAFLTVVASRWENFPYAAVEAMASGSPLISTDWSGSADLIVHGQSGWRTPIGHPKPLADRICWLLSNPAAASRAGAAAWMQCRNGYSIDSVGHRTVRFYEEILSRHAARD